MITEFKGKKVWTEDDFEYSKAAVGDYVDAQVVMNAMDCLPPVRMGLSCAQMGEPYSHKIDNVTDKLRPTFATFKVVEGDFTEGVWKFCGYCFAGETKERGVTPAYMG